MRAVHFKLGEQADGSALDTRDYTRTDAWHLTNEERFRAGEAMGKVWLEKFGNTEP